MQFSVFSYLVVGTFILFSSGLANADIATSAYIHGRRLSSAGPIIEEITAETKPTAAAISKFIGRTHEEIPEIPTVPEKNVDPETPAVPKPSSSNINDRFHRLDPETMLEQGQILNEQAFAKKSSLIVRILKYTGMTALVGAAMYGLYQFIFNRPERKTPQTYPTK